jgi:hypothetical protein
MSLNRIQQVILLCKNQLNILLKREKKEEREGGKKSTKLIPKHYLVELQSSKG